MHEDMMDEGGAAAHVDDHDDHEQHPNNDHGDHECHDV